MSVDRARVWRALFTLTALVLLVWYARTVDWGTAWRAMRAASPALLVVAALANLVTLAAKAVTWWIFLRPVGAPSFGLALRATAAGAGLNNLLIANSGDGARTLFVARASRAPLSGVLAALALERLFDFIGYVMLLIAAAFLLPLPRELARWRLPAVGALVLIGAALALLVWRGPRVRAPAPASTAAVATWRARAVAALGRFTDALHSIVSGPRLGAALALTVVNWGTQIACYHVTARAAHFPITLGGSIAALLAANVGFLVRVTPGNVGLFQVVYSLAAQALGLSRDAAVGVAVLLQAVQNIPVTLLGAALAPDLMLARRAPAAPPSGETP